MTTAIQVLPGIKSSFSYLTELLTKKKDEMIRTVRSMSGPFSSIVNFSVAQFLRRAEKLSILQTIKSEAECDPSFPFHFLHHHKQRKLQNFTATACISNSLSIDDIEQIVRYAFADTCELVSSLNVTVLNKAVNSITMDEVSIFIKNHLEKTIQINDSRQTASSDSESESDDEQNSYDADYDSMLPGSDNDEDISDSECLSNVSNSTSRGMHIYDSIKPSVAQSYFKVTVNSQNKYLHKQTACWLLTHDKSSLSLYRLKRVMNK
ncbi:unnamed protein product [Rotaria magnacalcarata]|uniref:Uncharacterized protein n=1 Tax=Rotaria magnacalcarata TaxID=392030 RepID=A0A816VAQ4_9BILA|nr:unnamed protein product [Rotaria magnacalcarata]CAF2051537.1 unnamed protein product [Rotaria magnacalcarata]CAF2120380.1 unnamed protein product [Rotaria magnacalcarata]CAF4316100.1 unnamed protein product [Rotaria magnacalcarata]CAF4384790.1 unnamed protein product [Rotaria magnacalcarata]